MPQATRGRASTAAPSLAADAVDLAQAGWAVFPCNSDKSPRTARGFHDASANPDDVAGMNWDGALIGAAIPQGQVVIDVDPRNGGDDTMAALKAAGHKIPKTRVVRTAGGGTHYYFAVAEGLELRGHVGQGVDVKRHGRGYVITPPTPGYTVARNDEVAELPTWLLDVLLVPERDVSTYEASAPRYMPWEAGTAYGLAARRNVLEELAAAQSGSRNDALNRAAFGLAQLVAGGELDEECSRAALEEAASDLGLGAAETRKTIASGWSAGTDEPRQAPPRDPKPEPVGGDDHAPVSMPVDESRFWLDWNVDEEPPAYLLEPILPENAYVLVYGSTEASKSMAFVAMGAEASRRGIRTTVYSLENPPRVDRDRLRRLRPDAEHFRMTNEPLDLNDARQFGAMIEREKEWGARLIIVDTYSHAFASRSEDGNARAIEFARRVRFLMHETGATVVVIDHTGYVQLDEPRDASAKRQQVDVAVLMRKEGEWKPGKPARFSMENKKAARFANPFSFVGEICDGADRALDVEWLGEAPEWRA